MKNIALVTFSSQVQDFQFMYDSKDHLNIGMPVQTKMKFQMLEITCHWRWCCHEESPNYSTSDEILRKTVTKKALTEFTVMQSYELPGRWTRNVGDIFHYSYQELYSAPCWEHTHPIQFAESDTVHPKQLHMSVQIAHWTVTPHSFHAPHSFPCIIPLLWPFLSEMLVLKPAWD